VSLLFKKKKSDIIFVRVPLSVLCHLLLGSHLSGEVAED
jgi:hypothetical protein